MIQIIGFLVLGTAAGMLAGFFGVGGGIIIVPLLILVWGFAPAAASGTSLVALLLPVSILGVLQYYKAGKIGPVEIRAGLLIATGLIFGALFGSKIALKLDPNLLRKGFAILMLVMAVRLWTMK